MSTPPAERAAAWTAAVCALDLDGVAPLLLPELAMAAPRDAIGMQARDEQGAASAADSVERAFVAIREADSRLRLFVTLLEARARRDATAVDARTPGARGALAGLTVAAKDCIAIAGAPMTRGSRATTREVSTRDAVVVERLVEAGAVVVGSTNMNEFGIGGFPLVGEVINPLDATRPAGGSSGGSAAAVAAGCVDIALGTDAGGSVRLPAAYCGVVGLKPSFGRLPDDGVSGGAPSLTDIGPIARGVREVSLAFAVLARSGRATRSIPATPRLGLLADPHPFRVEPQVRDAMELARERLRGAGVTVEVVEVPELRDWMAPFLVTITAEVAASLARLVAANPDAVSEEIRDTVALGALLPAPAYVQAQRYRRQLAEAVTAALETCDALVVQTLDRVAPAHETLPDDPLYWGECRWIAPFNLTGHPAISLPLPSDGMPPSLQLVGRHGDDEALLALAAHVEAVVGR
jgi:aspartyl-tRNA(Asn)/glutamyl-tRNA(Gln) amidotransferase subunit A